MAGVDDNSFAVAREAMVRNQLLGRDIVDKRVLAAMRTVPRHLFVPEKLAKDAYADHPLPIDEGQTISQPYIVAAMTQAAQVSPGFKVLDIGTGSAYQAAVLAEMGAEVYSLEIIKPLLAAAKACLKKLAYTQVHVRAGDGYLGWPEKGPFNAIIIAAAGYRVPEPLIKQLKVGGHLIMPVHKPAFQDLQRVTKMKDGTTKKQSLMAVSFVPMIGDNEKL